MVIAIGLNVEEINAEIDKLSVKDDISDGSHNFKELYLHRMILFSVICNQNRENSWKSRLHHDGTMYDDYFIVGIKTIEGDFTYHYHNDHWDRFNVSELDRAPEYDGHVSDDITRLYSLLEDSDM